MTSDYARDFFVFSYFGKDYESLRNIDDAIISCASSAYLDLNRTLIFDKTKTDVDKQNFKNSICKIIKTYVGKLLKENKDFGTFHSNVCEEIILFAEKSTCLETIPYTNDKVFTYGHAQKWVNMTLKYMYILDLLNENIVPKLHVPIDSYILKAISGKNGKYTLGNNNIIPKFHTDDDEAKDFGVYCADGKGKSQPWSKLNEKDYKKLQENLEKSIKDKFPNIAPIDWEGKAWIEIAKNTK